MLRSRAGKTTADAAAAQEAAEAARAQKAQPAPRAAPRPSNRQGMGEAFAKSLLRTIGSQVGREIIRGVLGSLRRR
jgi:hypothetical protein